MTSHSWRQIKDLPGPHALPLLGNLHQIKPSRLHLDIERWCRRYGTLFRIRFGPMTVLVVADHMLINQILRDRPDGFRRPSIAAEVAQEMGGRPDLYSAEGASWRNQRRMVMPALAPTAVKAYFPALVKVALRLRRRWEQAATTQRAIDLAADLKRYTVDVIAGLAFGTDVNTIEAGDDVIQQHLDIILPTIMWRSIMPIPYWRYIKLPADRRLDRSVAALTAAVDDLVTQACRRMQADPARAVQPSNLLEAMIVAAGQPDSDVDDKTVAGNVTTMLLAGEDATANTLAWLIYLLQRHPAALQRARDEVRRVVPDPASLASITVENMDALEYLGACIHESMRLKPVGPLFPVEALRDTVVADVQVPAGCVVLCVLRHHTVDPAYFPEPLVFDPERWLSPAASGADKHISTPFGGGPRTCPGRYLALLEIKVAMAMLLGCFEIDAIDTPDGKEAQEWMGFAMSPVGLRMRLRSL